MESMMKKQQSKALLVDASEFPQPHEMYNTRMIHVWYIYLHLP